ncbi:hypothetical protein AB4Y42_34535 [Paraburkholderia sp. EG286B]|uniref:hypothetical protein n=1 Tax=Paraburkholderia sp. EG286B TaxID=3237011 RepID=UPI0034D37495
MNLGPCRFCGAAASEPRIDQMEINSWIGSIDCTGCDITLTAQYTDGSPELAGERISELWNSKPQGCRMRTQDLRGRLLDEWVSRSFYEDQPARCRVVVPVRQKGEEEWLLVPLPFSTFFSEAERVGIFELPDDWYATYAGKAAISAAVGPTAAIAAARAYVMSVFGMEVKA